MPETTAAPKTLHLSASKTLLRAMAAALHDASCDGDVEFTLVFEHNGSGPDLHVVFDNDDMEDREDLSENCALWEMAS